MSLERFTPNGGKSADGRTTMIGREQSSRWQTAGLVLSYLGVQALPQS